MSGSDIANVGRYREDIIMQIVHRLPSSGLLGQWCWAAAIAWLSHRTEHDNLHAAVTTERNAASPMTVCHPSQGHESASPATVEPQKRLAPHVHIAIRGTASWAELMQIIVATYYQVWSPSIDTVWFGGSHLPVWDEARRRYLDPATGELLT